MFSMDFNEAKSYLLSLGNEVSTMKLGLENIRTLLEALGNPENNYLKVQVAGTNGKGSVCAFLNSICLGAGISTGLYTSPHLISITERIQINGAEIDEVEFARIASLVRETSEALVKAESLETFPTFFEQVTAIALHAFVEARVELAILETGLGGRLDATTAAKAEIAAITRIDLDHQKYLGETLSEIAAEKAAIIHAGSRVVALRQTHEAEQAITGRCKQVGVEPVWTTQDISVKRERELLPRLIATFVTPKRSYADVLLMGMLGEHQIENASVAISIAESLEETGMPVTSESIISGLGNTRHPGRLEHIDGFLLDGAHNPGGAHALRVYLDESVTVPITMIFGSMDDKSVEQIASILFPKADQLILTTAKNSRAIAAEKLFELTLGRVDERHVFVTGTPAEAVGKALELSTDEGTIVVTGSLYLVGEIKALLQSQI